MIPVSSPVRVRALLQSCPDGPVPILHNGPDAVYVDIEGHCIGVLGRRAVRVPNGLRSLRDRFAVSSASVRDGVLNLDGERCFVGRLVDVSVPRLPARIEVEQQAAEYPARIADVIGRGDGLTPYEDDVLCGWLALHRAAGLATSDLDAEITSHLDRTTALSAALLRCAMAGEVLPEFADLVRALGTPAEDARAASLARIGHSSGRGLLHGARLALDALTTHLVPA